MKNCAIVGASGYSGAQLAALIDQHPKLTLSALVVSAKSTNLNQSFTEVFPYYPLSATSVDAQTFVSLDDLRTQSHWQKINIVFLATPHEFSADVMPYLLAEGKQVIDLSGAYRLKSAQTFQDFYGFPHPNPELLTKACYGLPEVAQDTLQGAKLIAVAGCYPTVSILSLLPAVKAGLLDGAPIINAISGVSGAGRAAKLNTSFCEVSLQAYGVDSHRHTPEIEQTLQSPVVFTPHLGNFKRGILATITAPLKAGTLQADLDAIYTSYFSSHSAVRVQQAPPTLEQVVGSPFMHVLAKVIKQGQFIQVYAAIDNLMKGAASSAIQCCNLSYGWPEMCGLVINPKLEVAA